MLWLFDPTFILLIPAILFALWAHYLVKSRFAKYNKIQSSSGMTGLMVAQALVRDSGLKDINIEEVSGQLNDHYDPRNRTLRLSSSVARSRSVAALGITAHEVGHAIQHSRAYGAFALRQSIVPVVGIGSNLAFPMFFIGFIFNGMEILMDIGIFLFIGAVLFQLITLPVEFNASSRAMKLLRSRGYLAEVETLQAKKVLNAAALTYVAATAVALTHLLRLVLLRGLRD